jgi:hypothetical protein
MFVESKSHGEVTNPLDLGRLIAWLETKNPNEAYDYCEPRRCVFSQFMQASGYPEASCGSREINFFNFSAPHLLPDGWNTIAKGVVVSRTDLKKEWTFGEALKRAQKLERARANHQADC